MSPLPDTGGRGAGWRGRRAGMAGLTLVELLVAITILAVMAAFSFRGLTEILDTEVRLAVQNRQWRDVARFFEVFEGDLRQALARPVRAGDGRELAAWEFGATAGTGSATDLWMTRTTPGTDGAGGAPVRVGYRLRDGHLERLSYTTADLAPDSRPEMDTFPGQVTEFRLRGMDLGQVWSERWPPQAGDPGALAQLPRAVEVTLVVPDLGTIVRRFSW